MEKVIKTVDVERGIVQITTVDERWYAMPAADSTTQLPKYEFVPSVTWITNYYPKGIGFMKWLAEKGWDEAEAIKEAGGGRGSKVHAGADLLIDGIALQMTDSVLNPNTGQPEELTLEEWEALMSFVSWFGSHKSIKVVARNIVVWNKDHKYAGTLDLLVLIDGVLWLIDLKTSKAVYVSHRVQVSAYKHTPQVEKIMADLKIAEIKLGILQLGYKLNKAGWKMTEVEDQFELFLDVKSIWANETEGAAPKQKDYPVSLSLEAPVPPAPVKASTNGTKTKAKVAA